MNATLVANETMLNSTIDMNLCGISMNMELMANKANLAMHGFDLRPISHRRFDVIADWYSREFLILCNALRHTYSASEFDGLLQGIAEYNKANGHPEVAEVLTELFAKVEPREPCRVIPLRRRENPDSVGRRCATPGSTGSKLNLVSS